MLALWQRADATLWSYSPVGTSGHLAKSHRLTNSDKSHIVKAYHKFMLSVSEADVLTMHKKGLEEYERNFKGDNYDDMFDLLCQGVTALAELIEKNHS